MKVSAFLDKNGVEVLLWTAQSSDLSPTEHVWFIIKRRLPILQDYPTTREKSFEHLRTIRDELPETCFSNLVWSMISRCTSIRNVSGKSGKY